MKTSTVLVERNRDNKVYKGSLDLILYTGRCPGRLSTTNTCPILWERKDDLENRTKAKGHNQEPWRTTPGGIYYCIKRNLPKGKVRSPSVCCRLPAYSKMLYLVHVFAKDKCEMPVLAQTCMLGACVCYSLLPFCFLGVDPYLSHCQNCVTIKPSQDGFLEFYLILPFY